MALKRIACLGTATWTPYSLSLCWCVRLSCSDSTSLPLFHILDSRTHGSETVNWHHLPIFPKLPHYSKGLLMGLWTQPLVQTSWGYSHRLSHASVAFLLGQLKCSSVSETCRCSLTLIATFFVFFSFVVLFFVFFFLLPSQTQWTCLADCVLPAKCPPSICFGLWRKLRGVGSGAGAGST